MCSIRTTQTDTQAPAPWTSRYYSDAPALSPLLLLAWQKLIHLGILQIVDLCHSFHYSSHMLWATGSLSSCCQLQKEPVPAPDCFEWRKSLEIGGTSSPMDSSTMRAGPHASSQWNTATISSPIDMHGTPMNNQFLAPDVTPPDIPELPQEPPAVLPPIRRST